MTPAVSKRNYKCFETKEMVVLVTHKSDQAGGL